LFTGRGFSASEQPTGVEIFLARAARHMAIPREAYLAANPAMPTPEVLADARAHFADHCASCHANNGSGDTALGRNLYPKAPDMRQLETQSLTDGEIFYIIRNGIRLSGMPAWGSGDADNDRETWGLVHFIRRLSEITPDELKQMRGLNPISRSRLAEEEMERQFLAGESPERHEHGAHH
jgi:mono/diheme cytochrome c family protein